MVMPPEPSPRPTADRPGQPRGGARPWSVLVRLTLSVLGSLVPMAPASAQLQDPPYPSREALRQLQLLTFTCGRDNQAGACDEARRQADGLLDHPRLPGSCKDSLWQIREQAVVASSNSFARRDRLDRVAVDMVRFCQVQSRPAGPSSGSPAGPPGGP
jgi:hypothetical protein